MNGFAHKYDLTVPRRNDTANRHEGRGFTGPVGTDEGDDLTFGYFYADAPECLDIPIECLDPVQLKHRCLLPDRP